MLNDAQRAALADIKLPKPLQDMLDENIVDSRLPDYYQNSLPTYAQLTAPANALRAKLENDLATVVGTSDPLARKHLLAGVAATLDYELLHAPATQTKLIEPFVKADAFLQLTTAMGEEERVATRQVIAATKEATSTFLNDHLETLRRDMEHRIAKIEKQICRQLFALRAKHLFGVAPR